MRNVELRTAYHWICEDCGHDNFSLPVKAELTEEMREEAFREINGFQEWDDLPEGWECFELVQIPDTVKCQQCGAEFRTIDERVEPEDEPYDG